MSFNFYLPVNVIFGCGKVKEAGEIAGKYGKKALIVTGKSSARKSGLYDRVNDSLKAAGL
ncbi:MAG: iron-containing alcohol dehydrogenase, partial [Firmicutes bacterium]|nr:iron-containing alcohol dehydrogenase [Bacillota bacterium]